MPDANTLPFIKLDNVKEWGWGDNFVLFLFTVTFLNVGGRSILLYVLVLLMQD